MEIVYFIIVIAIIIGAWVGLAYFMNFCLQMRIKRVFNSKRMTDERIVKEYKGLDVMSTIFIFYGGPVGFFLAKKKFIPELKKTMEEKMRERNIEF